MSVQDREAEWTKNYLKPLEGATIVSTGVKIDPDGVWPIIHVRIPGMSAADHPDGLFEIEASRDEEGNGPGFFFGCPAPGQ